ncbi:hypothetical protein DXG01_014112 [Tephrocybe rancida]|nr:hypothetical protein DXG01_014112 [Tephrocybe rancida]
MGFDGRAKSKGEYCFMAGLGPISELRGQGPDKESKYTVYTPREDPRYKIAAKIVLCHHCDWVYILSRKREDILEREYESEEAKVKAVKTEDNILMHHSYASMKMAA